ncbi:MAG: hypothetical protein CL989_00720 [Euryarchaeota archaeon]|jgi:hypothetical protein|nr:hypothetical protein [Euryarchaeota archaeon]|tara:strand:+ start:637 stop:1128 length:492 start_codon:yes stop_codon:yes gene_type:complete
MLDEVLKSKENLPARPVDFMGILWGVINVKWDTPPIWPVAVPSILGFSIACADEILSIQNLFGQDLLLPILALTASSGLVLFLPDRYQSKLECILGIWCMILLAVIPQLIFFVWFVLVILFWLSQSLYVWKRNYPTFRLGIWLGAGGMSGLYLGSLFALNVLS